MERGDGHRTVIGRLAAFSADGDHRTC